jgi:plasmid stabilization system protein ParE
MLEAFRWLAERSPEAADRWYGTLEEAIAALARDPERFPVADHESAQFGITIRQLLHGRRRGIYRVLFTVRGDTVSILHVRHGARGPLEE